MMIKSDCMHIFRVMAVLTVACTMFGCEETHKAVIVGGGRHVVPTAKITVRNVKPKK